MIFPKMRTTPFVMLLLLTVLNNLPCLAESEIPSLLLSRYEQTTKLSLLDNRIRKEAFSWPIQGVSPASETHYKQSAHLAGLASRTLERRLFLPPPANVSAPYYQRNYRESWLSASLTDRIRISERIGNQGRARFCEEQGWHKVIGSQQRLIRQGPDSVYWDPHQGRLRVIEAKGGSSQPKMTYGSLQGTNENAVRSARFQLQSAATSIEEKLAAARVIKAAQRGQLETGVVKTSHVLGKPGKPRLEAPWSRVNVSKEAHAIEREITRKNPALARIFADADQKQAEDLLKYRLRQGVAVLGLAGTAASAWDAIQQSLKAVSMIQDRQIRGTALPYLQAGVAVGRVAQTVSLGLGSVAQLGWLGQDHWKSRGEAAGKWFLPLAVGVEVLSFVKTYYEYSNGLISRREFYRRGPESGIFVVCTTGGAIIGGGIGFFGGAAAGVGVGALPGTAGGAQIGAGIGAFVALPVQFVYKQYSIWKYRKLDELQQRAVDVALERVYGLR